ncbi:lipocalin family protein [Marinimicrobium locisalis]|uniref:lipocalin family protein n=1 Tax=Marinimicrobium locisalis TaxID=546022 RepID=UPI0032213B66
MRYLVRLKIVGVWLLLGLTGCSDTGLPEGLEPVREFELQRYLGEWHEIARLDHDFEEGLAPVTATYSRREDGGIRVVNRGYNAETGQWEEAEGRAYFIGDENVGRLKVSFFGPFYGSYNIIELSDDYDYSMVAGPDRSYLWILSREPELGQSVLRRLVAKAEALGFDTQELIYPATFTP